MFENRTNQKIARDIYKKNRRKRKQAMMQMLRRSVNEGNVSQKRMVLGYIDTNNFFGYISHFLAPLKAANIAIKK